MKTLSKADILGNHDLKTKAVEVPEWGGKVYLKELSGLERAQFEEETASLDSDKMEDQLLRIAAVVAHTISDENGNRILLFEDATALASKNFKVLHRLYRQAMALNDMGGDAVEDLGKNSEPSPRDDSISD